MSSPETCKSAVFKRMAHTQEKVTVELIHADTQDPFPSHENKDNGDTYVEIEPDAEYYIRIQTSYKKTVLCYYEVDGKDLGYHKILYHDSLPSIAGVWSRSKGKSIMGALKFEKAPVNKLEGSSSMNAPRFWTGQVKVKVYEAIENGFERVDASDHQSSWQGGDVGFLMGVSDPDKKKGVKTGVGTNFDVQKINQNAARINFIKGRQLETTTLNYCSVLGLIHAGLLPKPPLWDLHRIEHSRDEVDEKPVPPPKRIKIGGLGGLGDIAPPQEHDFFDLS